MYRAFFEYQESESSYLHINFINKILDYQDSLYTQNISIHKISTMPGFKKITIMLDILEDFTYELKSSFQSYKEALGEVSSIAGNITNFFDKLNTVSALGQITSKGADLMKVQVWKETEPFKMNFKFSLQTKTNPFIDVYLPAILLSSQTILSPLNNQSDFETVSGDKTGARTVAFKTPGVNKNKLQNQNTQNSKDRNSSSKVLDTFGILVRNIDNIQQKKPSDKTNYSISDTEYRSDESVLSDYNALVNIDYAFIESAKPTWSKERTTSGIPLWCELELTVQSVFSANDSMMGFMYPEISPNNSATLKEEIDFYGRAIGRAARSKVVNIFR
jgi:hypothetical protein